MATALLLLLLSCATYRIHSVPLVGDDPDSFIEAPTTGTIPLPPSAESNHEFVSDLSRCLKLRDEKRDLASLELGCVPDIFSTVEDVPLSSLSNTVLSYIAINSTLESNQFHFTVNPVEDSGLHVKINSVHLRIHKRGFNIADKLPHNTSSHSVPESGLIEFSLTFSSTKSAAIRTQVRTIAYKDLAKEGWIDWLLDRDIVAASEAPGTIDDILNITITAKNVSFQDIGIELDIKKEPVLVVFANEQMQAVIEMLLNQSIHHQAPRRSKKQLETGGSGSFFTDPEKCRLIKYSVPTAHIRNAVGPVGSFNFNYCTGQCVWPLPHQEGVLYYHPILLAIFQLDEMHDPATVTPPPCCVPVEYAAVSFLFRETAWSTKIKTILDMTATKCACR